MKVVLLAGGFGSRISEESQFKPKPMIEIGGMPILWHIMKEIVGKPLLDILLLVASADYKLGMTIKGILFHDMPQNRHTANLNHWLWLELAFFADTRTEATG